MNPLKFIKSHKVLFVSLLFICLFLVVFLADSIFVYVLPGQAGLLFRAFSEEAVSTKVYPPGLYVIAPWNKMFRLDITKQKMAQDVHALAKNGLQIQMKVATIYRPNPTRLRELALEVGPQYASKIMAPTISSSTREVIGAFAPEALYTTAVQTIQQLILEKAQRKLEAMSFIIEEVAIEELKLPASLNKAIETKLRRQQESLAYQFVLEIERDEAKRRRIEADSIAQYQTVIDKSLNDRVLRWMEIRAMTELGKSKNGKVVVFGGNQSQAPVLINPDGGGK